MNGVVGINTSYTDIFTNDQTVLDVNGQIRISNYSNDIFPMYIKAGINDLGIIQFQNGMISLGQVNIVAQIGSSSTINNLKYVSLYADNVNYKGYVVENDLIVKGSIGIGTNPTSKFHIYETTGTDASATNGSLMLQHNNSGGVSSIVFKSAVNNSSDFGYIKYIDNVSSQSSTYSSYNYFGSTNTETGALILGSENDTSTNGPDSVIITPAGNIALIPKNNLTYIQGNIGVGITNPSINDIISLSNSSAFSNINIKFTNNATSNAYIGIGGTNSSYINSLYRNNFFIHATCNIVLNANSNLSTTAPNLYISTTGNIGIGLTNPNAKLEIISGTASTGNITQYILSNATTIFTTPSTATADVCAIFNSSIWCKTKVTVSSDIRIKNNINDINDDSALQKILNIQPKTYNYIDNIDRGSNIIYGFIAQQIKEIIPEAITLTSDYIPNIYSLCSNNSNIIIIPEIILSNNNININDEITIINGNNYEKNNYIIKNINSNEITINENLNCSNCFVYGTKVNDFHTLNKEYIYTLNVCATQDLYKIIQEQKKSIDNLYEQLNIIKQILNNNNLK
jgi:hypothetical protein